MTKRVVVGLSGGVDSSVAAWLLNLDFLRETPAPKVEGGNAPKPLKTQLGDRIANLPWLPDQGDPGPKR